MGYLPVEGSSLDECREAYDQFYKSGGVSYKRREQITIVDGFVHVAGWVPGTRLLEVGCGIGFQAHLLARKGFQVTAIDFSQVAIGIAKKHRGPTYILQDATQYAPDRPFDGILFNDFSLFHYELEGINRLGVNMDAFMHRVFSWLVENGSVLIKAPINIDGLAKNTATSFDRMLRKHAGSSSHIDDAQMVLINARGRAAQKQTGGAENAQIEIAKSEPDSDEANNDDAPDGFPMGYPDPWGYGHKS